MNTLTDNELKFCQLFMECGSAAKCYRIAFCDRSDSAARKASELLKRPDIKEYLGDLEKTMVYNNAAMKASLTDKLLGIIDETSTAVYVDRRGTELSPAALRSVAVSAAKALMDMYPIKAAAESKLEISSENGSGITFNVIAPAQTKKDE